MHRRLAFAIAIDLHRDVQRAMGGCAWRAAHDAHARLQADLDMLKQHRFAKRLDVTRDAEYWVEEETGTVIAYDWSKGVAAAARAAEQARLAELEQFKTCVLLPLPPFLCSVLCFRRAPPPPSC